MAAFYTTCQPVIIVYLVIYLVIYVYFMSLISYIFPDTCLLFIIIIIIILVHILCTFCCVLIFLSVTFVFVCMFYILCL